MNTKEEPIRVKHPEYGHVEFYGMSIRQKEVLKTLEKSVKSSKFTPNKKVKNG